jgi:DNA-binding ferritin-like protein (Dps family)
VIELPHRHVHNIGTIVNSLMGPGATFPGPPLPQHGLQRNPLTLLGGFMYSFQFQLMRLIPFMSRLADLLQRESQMTNSIDRQQTQALANEIGKAMEEITTATQSVAGLFRNLQIGNNPGEFRVFDRQRNTQAASQSFGIPQVQGMGIVVQQAPVQIFPNIPQGNTGNALNVENPAPTVNTTQNTAVPSQNNTIPPERMEIIEESSRIGQRQTGSQLPTPPNSLNSSEVSPTRPPQHPPSMRNTQNILQLLSMLSGPAASELTLGEIMKLINSNASDQDEIAEIFGRVRYGDIMVGLQNGEMTFLDKYVDEIKQGYTKLLAKYKGNRKELEKQLAQRISNFFKVPVTMNDLVFEGFEPQTVAQEILESHLPNVIDIIERENYGNERFSALIGRELTKMVQKIMVDVSEGYCDGLDGLQKVYKAVIKEELHKLVGIEIGNILFEIFQKMGWEIMMKAYNAKLDKVSANQEETKMQIVESNRLTPEEEQVIEELSKVLEEDDPKFAAYDNIKFSKTYEKGDINYEEKKEKDSN